ncbi:MAG: endolytic transglycosylase MltG [Candidatus Cloacimonetes bacterium]|nr:endolytic transglycosylase MltG [Candidatus Cloacimonadota bacterium]
MRKTIYITMFVVLGIMMAIISNILTSPLNINQKIIDINEGQSARSIAKVLYKEGVIRSESAFYILVRLTNNDKKLKQGAYLFNGKMNMLSAMQKIISGEILVQRVTIPEGLSLYKTIRILSDKGIGNYDRFLELAEDNQFIKSVSGFEIETLEGFLYPDTYAFNKNNSEEIILEKMVQNLFNRLRKNQINFDDKKEFYRILKLASIVEKEAVFPEEKPLIASVYQNRLNNNMLLQADPTSTYHLEADGVHKSKLYYKDVRKNTLHNTYTNPGLPPTPICSPSISAIQASIRPANTNYLFFFATPEKRHIFTTSYAEHLKKQKQMKS